MSYLDEKIFGVGTPLANAATGTLINVLTTDANNVPVGAVRFTGAAPTVTGLIPSRRPLFLVATGGPVIVANENAGSVAGNRIVTGTGANITLANGSAALLVYDTASARWRMAGGGGIASGGAAGGSLAGTYPDPTVKQLDGTGGVGLIIPAETLWGIATSGGRGKRLVAPVNTTNATLTTLVAIDIPSGAVVDMMATIVGRRFGGAAGAAGDCYRADFPVCYQRIAAAAPSLVGAAAVETGKKSNGGGSAYAGSVAISGNNILFQATGVVDTSISWTCSVQAEQV